MVNTQKLSVLTGYAGTGKSSTLRGVLAVLERAAVSYALLAPTGKAAKVMGRYTGRRAFTIHNALINGGNGDIPVVGDCKYIIVDESSMVDISLCSSLLSAMAPDARLLLMGDPGQLSSIRLGNLLGDVLGADVIPRVTLDQVFRQAADSGILSLATKIRTGERIWDGESQHQTLGEAKDAFLWMQPYDANEALVTLYKAFIKEYGLENVAVLSPMRKGDFGASRLNALLRDICNPASVELAQVTYRGNTYRVGDKVMHIKNDYSAQWIDETGKKLGRLGVFNGECGVVLEADDEAQTALVKYDEFCVLYADSDLGNLALSYVTTVHKMQGSSAKAVIVLFYGAHWWMLSRQLGYTAVTRAEERVGVIAAPGALRRMVENDRRFKKQTLLPKLLREAALKGGEGG